MARAAQQHLAPMGEPFGERFRKPDDLGDPALHQDIHVERNAALEFAQPKQRFHHQGRIDRAGARLDHQADILRELVAHISNQRKLASR